MTTGMLVVMFLMLVPAGAFGACLPVIRELGRPTRLACAMFCGSVALGCGAALFVIAGQPLSLPLLIVPIVVASVVAARMLCRLSESPGPENAYPGFAAAMIVLAFTVYLVASLATAPGPQADTPAISDASSISLVASGAGDTVHASGLPVAARMLPVAWLLGALPLVAALLAIHVPLRRGWMIAAIWYATMAASLALWQTAPGSGAPRFVFVSLAALGIYGSAKEPRLLSFASVMLCGATLGGREALGAVLAVVAAGFARDLGEGVRRAPTRAALVMTGPAIAVILTLLHPGDAGSWNHATGAAFALNTVISISVLAAGLLYRGGSPHARPSHRAAHAR